MTLLKLYKYGSDQGRLKSFKHLSKQSIRINTFNIFSKIDRNHTLPEIVWTVVSTNFRFYKGSLRINGFGFWFDFCFTALQHILGHFERGQLPLPHCSWASLLGSLPVLSAHSFASNWQLLFLNQRKRENGRRNLFMTKSPRKNVPDVGIELGAACMPSGHASDRATAPGIRINALLRTL